MHVSIERWVAATTLRLDQVRPEDLSELGSILHSESNGMAKQKASTRNDAGWMGGDTRFGRCRTISGQGSTSSSLESIPGCTQCNEDIISRVQRAGSGLRFPRRN